MVAASSKKRYVSQGYSRPFLISWIAFVAYRRTSAHATTNKFKSGLTVFFAKNLWLRIFSSTCLLVHIPADPLCRGLTKTFNRGTWIFGLPTEVEWDKVARGPDNFDYGLGMIISDKEVNLYNWKKNPGAEITVVGLSETKSKYRSIAVLYIPYRETFRPERKS